MNYLTVGEAADDIGRSTETIRRWIKSGKINDAKWIIDGWGIPKDTVEALAAITPTREEQLAINGRNAVKKLSKPRKSKPPKVTPTQAAINKRQEEHDALMARIRSMGK